MQRPAKPRLFFSSVWPGLLLLLLAGIGIGSGPASAQTVFSDDFETTDLQFWAPIVNAAPEALRVTDLDVRDPHFFVVVPVFGCNDFTDVPLPAGIGPSVNGSIATSLTTDGDLDGFLDLSPLFVFRPLLTVTSKRDVETVGGLCTDPLASTVCTSDPDSTSAAGIYDNVAAGACLDPLPGTTSLYTPSVASTPSPCFRTRPSDLELNLNGATILLEQAQAAGVWVGSPPTGAAQGLLRGFLSEAQADLIEFPQLPGVPLSALLPGGTGACGPGDDRDILDGVSGWWFYLNFTAERVPFTPTVSLP